MTPIRKSKIFILVLLVLLLPLISPIFSTVLNVNEDKSNFPRSSGFWVMGPLHIDDDGGGDYNWTEAVAQPWCSGNGSLLNPYLLENITIDGGGVSSGILIEDSNNKFFTIRNCTLINAGGLFDGNGGIKLMSTTNGTIINNKCLNNMKFGIIFEEQSNYNLVQDNYLFNSTQGGVALYHSSHNTIVNNNISNDGSNNADGFFIIGISEFNTISNNRIIDQLRGIVLNFSPHNNTISDNYISGCSFWGITVWAGCNNNTIQSNKVIQSGYGIGLIGDGNLVYLNNITGINNDNGDDSGKYNKWDNGTIGNFWDDYGGSDLDDDGIGDSAYDVPGTANALDNYPIWDDGDDIYPTISINSPSGLSSFGPDAPTYSLNIFDLTLNTSWYTLNNPSIRYFFTPSNGVNIVPIDEAGWDSFSDGAMLLTFYVNDSNGNTANVSNVIRKDATNPTISLESPPHMSTFGTDAPTYSLNIFDLNLNTSWYILNNTAIRYFFTPSNGINVVPIDETGWDSFSDGYLVMGFFVNDSGGNLVSDSHVITKDTSSPTIILNSPLGGTIFGTDAPEFNLTIYDLYLHDAWYTIGTSATQHPFSPSNGINIIPIDESSWDALPEGSITMNFFVNDTAGNTRTIQVIINRDLPSPAIPFGNYYILFLGIGIATLLLAEQKKRKK